MSYPASVRIVEVGPRDGLQNEHRFLPTSDKVRFIESLAGAGLQHIEAGSFVSPRSIPAMADSADVFRALRRLPSVHYTALVPNTQGLDAALAANVNEVAVFASASETFSQRNIHCSTTQSLDRYREVCRRALAAGLRVRGYVSCIAGCPYEGAVSPDSVIHVTEALLEMGCYEVSLGDTIGVGTPVQIEILLTQLLATVPESKLAVHFHDTWGCALPNILVALQAGICVVDSSAAGLGGCPFAPGAAGNVATEDVLFMLDGMQIETGIDLAKVADAGREVCALLQRSPASKASLALLALHRR